MRVDVVVLGSGPAGLAAAAACARRGLAVALVAADPQVRWPNTYGAWADELAGVDLPGAVAHAWGAVTVVGAERHVVPRGYAILDNDAVAVALWRDLTAAGSEVVAGRAVGANHDRRRSTAVLADGRIIDAMVVVDATGHRPAVVYRPERPAPAFQTACGVVARCSTPPIEPGTCVLMDWSGGHADDRDPTFLYAMDFGAGHWFLEETSLVRRQPMHEAVLRRRLDDRLAAAGVRLEEIVTTEHVVIPMGGALPSRRQRAVGFGAAAGMVHPSTGYSVAAALTAAPALADAIAAALDRRATPTSVSAAAWDAVWPAPRLRARALEQYGQGVLLGLDRRATADFFDAFFSLPVEEWGGYVSGTLAPRAVAGVMQSLLRAAPLPLKARLAAADPRPLVSLVRR